MASSPSSSQTRAMHLRLCQMGGGFIVAGLVGTAFFHSASNRLDAVAGWPSVTGRIIGADAEWGVVKIGRTPHVQRLADVRYAYFVNGQRYECDARRVLPMLHTSDGSPEEICARYPVGMAVAVYYDPDNPADALLVPEPEKGVRKLVRITTFITMFLGFLGLVMAGSGAMHLRAGERAERTAAIEARRSRSMPAQPTVSSPAAGAAEVSTGARAPQVAAVRRRPTHWLVRLGATVLGLFLMMMGSLLAITAAKPYSIAADRAVEVTCLVFFAGVGLAGAYLITRGMRRPTVG